MALKAPKDVKNPGGQALARALDFAKRRLELLKPLARKKTFSDGWISWWRTTVSGIKEHFGEGSDEYQWVTPRYRPVATLGEESPQRKAARERKEYSEGVKDMRNALHSILDKYEALGDSIGTAEAPKQVAVAKAFISHGGRKPSLATIEDFLRALGVEPIVVGRQGSEGREVHDNVDHYRQPTDFAIVLWTKDFEDSNGNWHPSGSVAVESGELRMQFKNRVIYLREEGVELPAMAGTIVYEPFTNENMAPALQKIVTELHTWGWLKVSPKQGSLADSPVAASPEEAAGPANEASVPEEEGIWDWIVQTQESLERATQEVLDMNAVLTRMSRKIKSKAGRVQELNKKSGPRTAALVHAVLSAVAKDMLEYTHDTGERIPRYREAWEQFEKSITSLIASPLARASENREGLESLKNNINTILPSFEVAVAGSRSFQSSIGGLRGLSRDLNAASRDVYSVVTALIDEIEKSRSICARVAALLDEAL